MNSIESVSDLGIDQQVISEKIKQMILSPKHPQTPSTMQITTTDEQNIKLELQKQFEYYFSSKNLQNDSYLRSQMDQDNYVPIAVIAQFKRIKQLTNDTDLICFVIRQSTQLQLDSTNTKVRSIGGSAGGLITITNSFTKKPNKTTFNTIEQSNLQQQRSVLILREVASEATLEQVKDLFTNKEPNCPPCHQCESAGNDSWYVTFNNEEEAQKALQYLKIEIQTFLDKPIRARIKAHTMMPRSTSASLNNNNSNNNKVLNTTSPPLTPPVSTYNQHILTYDTPPSSSYMSQTSSPSPAPTYQNSLIGSTNPVSSDMMAAAFHDGSIQIMVSNDNNHQANNQYNYLNFNNNNQSQHLKYLPNSKQIGLISNHQQYLFANSTMNSPNGMRPILVPNTNNNQQHNQYWQIQNNNNYTQRSKYQQNDEKNVSSSTNSSTSINNDLTKTQNDSLSEIDSSKYFSSPNQSELNDALLIYPNQQQQSILQIPSYYQSQPTQPPVPQQQQQQMIQIQLNSNNYNRSSPASFQAYYQPVSQSPSQSQQQHYISTNQQQQTALLSSASSSSINNNNNNNTNNQSYQQPQYIIQNPQYLSHTQSGVAINQNYYNNNNSTTNSNNNNSSNKSSTPTPVTAAGATGSTSSGSSSANTLSGSSNGSQQIITSPVYNTNPYLIATINNNPNNNTNTGGNSNPAFNAAAAYQYYQAYNNAFTNGGYAQTTPNQFSNNPYTGSIQQHQQQPQIYSTNQQQQPPPSASQAYYDIVTTQSAPIFDGSQNAIPLSALQQTNLIAIPSNVQLQSQSQVNLSQNEKTNDGSVAHIASLTAASSQPAVFIYPNQNQYQTHNLILNTAAAGQNTTAPQLLMTTALSGPPNGPNNHQIHHITALPSYTQISSQNSSTTTNNNTISSSNTNTTTATTTNTNNNNQRRTISGSSTNNNNNPVFNSHYQVNTHRNYNSNSRVQKYATNNEANSNSLNQQQQQNNYNNTHSQNYSHHHPLPLPPPSSSYHHHSNNHSHHHNYQSNKAYHQSVNSSNAHSIVSESATSSSRSSTSNTPLIMALNINNVNLNENKSIEEMKNSGVGPGLETDSIKSPPNNSDLVSFPPLLNSNSNSIPVNTTNHTRQQQTLTSSSSAIVSVAQLNETAEMTSEQLDPAIICISNSAIPSTPAIINNNNSNSNTSNSINTNPTSQVNRNSKQAGNTNKTITEQQQTNENNQIPNISNNNQTTVSSPAKHHQGNLKQYEIIKSHLGFNNNNNNNNNNRSDYYSQQKSNNSSTPNSIYNKSSGNSYSRKSIDGIHSQSRSHHSTNPGTQTLPSKFHSNNSERSSSTSSGSNKKFSNQQQSSNENKNEHSNSSPSFNRKGNKGGSSNSNNKKENLKSLNENKNTQLNDQLSPTHSNNTINNSNSLSPSQINEDDSSNNSWNNKKLTFAEIVQQKANSNGVETSNKLVNTTNNNTNQQEHSNGTSLVITSTNSINSSQATSPTVQQITDANSPFNSSLTSESLTTNDSLNLNESNPTITTTNSSIQV